MKKLFLTSVVAVFMILTACGGSQAKDKQKVSESTSTSDVRTMAETVTIKLEGHDNMKYSGDTKVEVKAGQQITVNFKNVGKLPKETMGHNVVVLALGTDVAAFATEAIKAKDNDYIPSGLESSIIAHTKLLGPGESDSVTFRLDTPGVYDFICTFPGHWAIMRGTITVK